MPVSSVERPVSALRQRMLEDMAMRGLRSDTQHDYVIRVVPQLRSLPWSAARYEQRRLRTFAGFRFTSARAGATTHDQLLRFALCSFFYFTVTPRPAGSLSRRLVLARYPRKLPAVLSVEEVGRLLEAAPGIKYKAILGTAYGAGLRVSEVASLKVDDIDSTRMLIRGGTGQGTQRPQ